jgi:hypothetical protein
MTPLLKAAVLCLLLSAKMVYGQVDDEDDFDEDFGDEEEMVEEEAPKKMTSEISGSFGGDYRYFPKEGLYDGQENEYFSTVFKPEIYLEWNEGKQLLQFTGFARLDQYDTKRTHADLRELFFQSVFKKSEISIGVKKIYWGVTESNHLADVINQYDILEGFDTENKLGQPMIHYSTQRKWGQLDFMVMPYFREMKFPGPKGRLRPPFDFSQIQIKYESDNEEYNPDLAVRWSHSIGVFDIGVAQFYGTSRLPYFEQPDSTTFLMHYETMNRTGLDLQASTGSMLWKLEAIYRMSEREDIYAYTVGGEYTFSNLLQTGIDLGLIAEYSYDERGIAQITNLDDDLFLGTRVAFNDRQSSDLLGGVIIDQNNQTLQYFVEANRRLGDSWKMSLNASGFDNIDEQQFLYLLRNDGFVQFSLSKFF